MGRRHKRVFPLILSCAALSFSCGRSEDVELRPFPYPYRAALAIASDCDEMDSVREFLTLQTYLCDTVPTPLGQGLGLETGNSFWFYDTSGRSRFTYFQDLEGTPAPASLIIDEFIAAGYLDCLHSYGEFRAGGFERSLAERSVAVLKQIQRRRGTTVRIWSHHGDSLNTQNLGRLSSQRGDDPGTREYHVDLLISYGLKYLDQWDVTHVIGQDAPLAPLDYVKEAATFLVWGKNRIAGVEQQAFLRSNDLLRPLELDDGHWLYAYRRYINSWGRGSVEAASLAHQISEKNLGELVQKRGAMIVYTHLGANSAAALSGPDDDVALHELIPVPAREALAGLARRHNAGEILVTTTARLLTYQHSRHNLQWEATHDVEDTVIEIGLLDDAVEGIHSPRGEEIMGLTFYVPSAARARVLVGGREIPHLQRNPADETGRESVTIPWRALQFPRGFDDERWLAKTGDVPPILAPSGIRRS